MDPDPTYYLGIIGVAHTPMGNVAESCCFYTDPVPVPTSFFPSYSSVHVPDPALVPYIPVILREKIILSLRFQLKCMKQVDLTRNCLFCSPTLIGLKLMYKSHIRDHFVPVTGTEPESEQDHHGSGSDRCKIILFRQFRSGKVQLHFHLHLHLRGTVQL
jgi:hypothetical protein